jgi:DNA processing protein
MAGGLLNLYPRENTELFSEISKSGLLVSECAPEVAPTKWRFLQRNRLIAAHGRATVVIEAAQRSGARNTAGHAFGCGKEVFAFPGPQSSEQHRGCNLLIRDGIARGVNDVGELTGILLGNDQPFKQSGLSSDETRVMDSLSRHPRTLERICLESGMSKHDAIRTLRQLALYHIAFSTPRGWMLA